MKQISSLELHFLLKELDVLKDSRIDKIYQPEKNVIVFSLYKANLGKKMLKIVVGKALFIFEEKENYAETLGFGMLLRKHLDGYFLQGIEQIKPERILRLSFKTKSDMKCLYLEFFGKGNTILCDEKNMIINSLEHHEFKERAIKPKNNYKYPVMQYNLFDIDKTQLIELFKNSKKDSLVISLAVELGFGGVYSEETCLLSNIDKNADPKNMDEKQIQSILTNIKKLIDKKIEPKAVFQDSNLIDAIPFDLEVYGKYDKQKFTAFNEALSFYYSHFREAEETEFDRKLRSLQRIVEEQKQAIEELKKEEKELREKGEFIYHKYNLVKEVLEEINKASKKYSWKEIKEKLKGHKVIKEINEKDRKVVVEIE